MPECERVEHEGSGKYKEMNNNIKRCMKKAKENWIGENLRKKTVITTIKNLAIVATIQIVQENASQKNERY